MTDVDTVRVMSALKGFQRDAVDHVIERFYGDSSIGRSRRFLVADETGLGKSIIARGVIARTIDALKHDATVDRIDIVYICSNADLANQNLRRLNVTGQHELALATRLTLLARDLPNLNASAVGGGKKVNLISFTPATSGMSGGGWRTGRWEERALLAILLRHELELQKGDWSALLRLFAGTKKPARFRDGTEEMRRTLTNRIEPAILAAFRAELLARNSEVDTLSEVRSMIADNRARRKVEWHRLASTISRLRQMLAKASVTALEPDLVILDEFQKFRELLEHPESSDVAELADSLFRHDAARVLLLSATPYSPFTRAEEAEDNHYADFMRTVGFLTDHDATEVGRVRATLEKYRAALIAGDDATSSAHDVRAALLPYMTRSERPHITDGFVVRDLPVGSPTPEDIVEFATLRAFGEQLAAPIDVEYWKSIPYFANFMDGYKPGERARSTFGTPQGGASEALLSRTRSITRHELESFTPLDPGNGYLRALREETVGRGWWRLLWVPPSMPYLEPGPIFASHTDLTKRLVFSAWSGVPTSVASLLSYSADREIAAHSRGFLTANTSDAREKVAERFTYRLKDGAVAMMSTLALFWPHPELAHQGDPLEVARRSGGQISASDAERDLGASLPPPVDDVAAWEALFSVPGATPADTDAATLIQYALGSSDDEEAQLHGSSGLMHHVEAAQAYARQAHEAVGHRELARLSLHSPGNIAYRAVKRAAGAGASDAGVWTASFVIADGLRRFFDRMETVATIIGIYGEDPQHNPYWTRVLSYCADGNLQAVLDEYLFQLRSELGGVEIDDDALLRLAHQVSDVMRLRPARYQAHDTTQERVAIPFTARFALRYGARFGDAANVRDSVVRAAFNSPFAPFVLISTSIGQEGIDFHWWCHSVLHWNLPSNPVDFEQREGRVNRFAGHAIRRNVAHQHWPDVLESDDADPWRAAFDAAVDHAASSDELAPLGEFAPWWVYPGPARVERVLARYPLSRDHDKYERLRDSLALYRLTLGQPRQEDMVELLSKRGVDGEHAPTIDLRPPRSPAS